MIRKAYTWGVDLVSVSALCQFCNVPGFENNPRDLSWWSEHPFLNDGSFEIMQCFAWGQHSLCRSSLNLSRFKFIIQLCQVFEYLWGSYIASFSLTCVTRVMRLSLPHRLVGLKLHVPESIFENCESLLQIGFVHMQFFLSLDVFRLGCLVYRPTAGRAC